jgi:hypothetical protein
MSHHKEELFPDGLDILVTGNEFVSEVFRAIIRSYEIPRVPRKAEIIMSKLIELYKREFENAVHEEFYLRHFSSSDDLHTWLKTNLLAIPEIEELNLSQNEFAAGVKVSDESRSRFSFCSAHDSSCPFDEDFIDLDALVRNICHGLIRNAVEINFSTF